jgi:hypothetical protein
MNIITLKNPRGTRVGPREFRNVYVEHSISYAKHTLLFFTICVLTITRFCGRFTFFEGAYLLKIPGYLFRFFRICVGISFSFAFWFFYPKEAFTAVALTGITGGCFIFFLSAGLLLY